MLEGDVCVVCARRRPASTGDWDEAFASGVRTDGLPELGERERERE